MMDAQRRAMASVRDAIGPERRAQASRCLVENLLGLEEYQCACGVMSYMPISSEADVEEFNRRALADGKALYLPVSLEGGQMFASRLRGMDRLRTGRYGVREPERDEPAPRGAIQLIVIPGLAFDRQGGRMGYGAGYYDRFLPHLAARRVGVCFEAQLVERVPMGAHDVPMEILVTERGVYRPAGSIWKRIERLD